MRQHTYHRVTTAGYVEVYCPGHPRATGQMVHEHILVVERALGKYLPLGAKVHHVNGKKTENRNTNLVACNDEGYHATLHVRQRALDECGNANWRKCFYCKRYDDLSNLVPNGSANQFCHSSCRKAGCRAYYVLHRDELLAARKRRRANGGAL